MGHLPGYAYDFEIKSRPQVLHNEIKKKIQAKLK